MFGIFNFKSQLANMSPAFQGQACVGGFRKAPKCLRGIPGKQQLCRCWPQADFRQLLLESRIESEV